VFCPCLFLWISRKFREEKSAASDLSHIMN
jgi:hypothetical protein